MKSLLTICLLLALSTEASAYKLRQMSRGRMMNEDDDLDALMDKYDSNEKKPGQTAAQKKSSSAQANSK